MTLALPMRGSSADVRPGKYTSDKLAAKLRARRLDELRASAVVRLVALAERGEVCPVCGCTPDGPRCTVLVDGQLVGECVPSGTHGLASCSAHPPAKGR